MLSKLIINKSSKEIKNYFGHYIIEKDIKTNLNILINFPEEDLIIEGNIITGGFITIIAKTIKIKGNILHRKGITIFGLNIKEEKLKDGVLIKI